MTDTREASWHQLLAELRNVRRKIDRAAALAVTRDELLRAGRELGIPSSKLAEAAGVTDSRVRQLAPGRHELELRDESTSAQLERVPRLAPDAPLLSGAASVATRQPWRTRVSAWVELHELRGIDDDGHTFVLEDTSPRALLAALPATVDRVFLCGSYPQGQGSSNAERVRSWGLEPAGEGWSVADAGHYTGDADAPVYRWTRDSHEGQGAPFRTVEVLSAFGWFGDATAVDCWHAWAALGDAVRAAFPGGALLSTPATTGRDLWRRTIGAGKSYPVMSDELRELIRSTSGQGRAELLPAARPGQTVDAFTYLDGRFMYAALTWGLPVGEPTRWTRDAHGQLTGRGGPHQRANGEPVLPQLLAQRGRWLVTATVPDEWDHVGILPCQRDGGGWRYPSAPGETFTTWADACEIGLADRHGWTLELHEGLTWAEGKPLNAWTTKLVAMWEQLRKTGHTTAARGVRAMLLFAIGAFAGGTHMITRSCSLDDTSSVPDNARARVVGDQLVWEEPAPATGWAATMAHPEWSAQIWARARVRLLDAPGVGTGNRIGALHVPRDRVVAFRTDALYLDGDPSWGDDDKVGRFRIKGQLAEPVIWPADNAQLFALRDRAEA